MITNIQVSKVEAMSVCQWAIPNMTYTLEGVLEGVTVHVISMCKCVTQRGGVTNLTILGTSYLNHPQHTFQRGRLLCLDLCFSVQNCPPADGRIFIFRLFHAQ